MNLYGTDANGNPVYIDQFGNVMDANGNVLTDLSGITTNPSMATEPSNPTLPSASASGTANSDSAASIVAALGQWGTAIAGIVTKTPVTSTAKGATVGTAVPQVQTSAVTLLLFIIGGLLLVKALSHA